MRNGDKQTIGNASHFSARYAERKRAAERASDAASGPRPCNKCPETSELGSIFCKNHGAEYAELRVRFERGEVAFDDLAAFCDRTYWP